MQNFTGSKKDTKKERTLLCSRLCTSLRNFLERPSIISRGLVLISALYLLHSFSFWLFVICYEDNSGWEGIKVALFPFYFEALYHWPDNQWRYLPVFSAIVLLLFILLCLCWLIRGKVESLIFCLLTSIYYSVWGTLLIAMLFLWRWR